MVFLSQKTNIGAYSQRGFLLIEAMIGIAAFVILIGMITQISVSIVYSLRSAVNQVKASTILASAIDRQRSFMPISIDPSMRLVKKLCNFSKPFPASIGTFFMWHLEDAGGTRITESMIMYEQKA